MMILIVEPQKAPYSQEIEDTLEAMQAITGGMIQAIYPFEEEVALICNEEGKLMSLPANRGLFDDAGSLYDIVCGTFFLCGAPADSECFTSLTPEQIERYKQRFQTPEVFVRLGSNILCLPLTE